MFSLFKKKNLVTALDRCQALSKKQGFDMELTVNEYRFLTESSLFKDVDLRFSSQSLSNYGGLSWCLAQMLERAITHSESGKNASDTMLDLTEKLAGIVRLIGNSMSQLKLTHNDMEAIKKASQAALEWEELTAQPSALFG